MANADVLLRRTCAADARAAADVWLRSYTAALPGVRSAHEDPDVREWFALVLVPPYEIWVAVGAQGRG
jgi:hypothetical protein